LIKFYAEEEKLKDIKRIVLKKSLKKTGTNVSQKTVIYFVQNAHFFQFAGVYFSLSPM
jgi:hypothetical protein